MKTLKKVKTLIVISFAFISLLCTSGCGGGGGGGGSTTPTNPTLSISSVTNQAGSKVSKVNKDNVVTVILSLSAGKSDAKVCAYTIGLKYDATKFEPVNDGAEEMLISSPYFTYNPANGVLNLLAAKTNQNTVIQSGKTTTVLTAKFKAISSGNATFDFDKGYTNMIYYISESTTATLANLNFGEAYNISVQN